MRRLLTLLTWALVPGMVLAFYMAFIFAPTEAFMGDVQRIFYLHLASAWNAFAAFGIVFIGSFAYLRSGSGKWDRLAAAAVEIGVLFTTITLVSGTFWARNVWGAWWEWDPRLTSTLVMWLMYVAYLLLRQGIDDPERRGRLSAVLGILAFVNVPIVHMSVQWWRSLHPHTVSPGRVDLHPDMWTAALIMVAAFFIMGAVLLIQRLRILALEQDLAALDAGEGVSGGGPLPGA